MTSERTINNLPDEVLLDIFAYVGKEDLVTYVQNVCGLWRDLAQDNRLWKNYTFFFPNYKTNKVINLLKKMPRLKSFVFNQYMNLDRVVDTLCIHCKEIASLNSCDIPGLLPKHWNSLAQHLPDVECLHVHPACLALEPIILGKFSKLEKLKSTAAVPDYYNTTLKETKGCQNLKEFEIMSPNRGFCVPGRVISNNSLSLVKLNLYGVQDSVFAIVPQCQKLETLTLNFSSEICGTFRSTLPVLGKLQNLKSLCLQNFVDGDRDILCQLFVCGNLPSLVELDLKGCMNFSERVAASIAGCCPSLQVLNLNACTKMDDACMEKLARCQQLQVLNLSGCERVTENSLVRVGQLRHVHTLYFAWIGVVTRAALEALSTSISLRKVVLDFNKLQEPDVLNMASRMPSLNYLSLYGCTDLDPVNLQRSLRSVWINSTRPKNRFSKT